MLLLKLFFGLLCGSCAYKFVTGDYITRGDMLTPTVLLIGAIFFGVIVYALHIFESEA